MILSTLIESLATIMSMVITLYIWIVIASALISFVNPDPYNPIVQTLRRLTEPVYGFIRRYIPTVFGGVDLAPLIVIFGLQFLDLFLVKILFGLAHSM